MLAILRFGAVAVGLGMVMAGGALAQPAVCFDAQPVPGWDSGDTAYGSVGVARPGGAGGFELCSSGAGFGGAEDAHHYLVQRRHGDFVLEAELAALDGGEAGLALRRDVRKADSAMVAVLVRPDVAGGYLLRSTVRTADGEDASDAAAVEIPVSLPLRLRLERAGSMLTTSYAEGAGAWMPHAVVAAESPDLGAVLHSVGMVQTSTDGVTIATAVFTEAAAVDEAPDGADPSGCMDTLVVPQSAGGAVTLVGNRMDAVRSVTVGGVAATIGAMTSESLEVILPPSPNGAIANDVMVLDGDDAGALRARVAWAGEPFVRADISGDGRVTGGDLRLLRRWLAGRGRSLACPEAADVDADGDIDPDDATRLEGWLGGVAAALPAPFPDPGLAPGGGRSCGQPRTPRIKALRDEQGKALAEGTVLREGDIVTLLGKDFPEDPQSVAVVFADTPTRVLEGSSRRRLRLEIGAVPATGSACPTLYADASIGAAAARRGLSDGDRSLLGPAWGVLPEQGRPDLCPGFEASALEVLGQASVPDGQARLWLPLDEGAWDPRAEYTVQVHLELPMIDGISRGPRLVRFAWRDTLAQEAAQPAGDYPAWLEALAARLTRELNYGPASADGCACDAEAEADPDAGGIWIGPCDPVISWLPNDPGPEPPAPPKQLPLKNPPPPRWGAVVFKAPVAECEGVFDPQFDAREYMWCEFAKQTELTNGLPRFEWRIPLSTLLGGPTAIQKLAPPADRLPSEKAVSFSVAGYYSAIEHGYTDPCAAAARRYYCDAFNNTWMPPFPAGDVVMKTFWRGASKLPVSADPDDYYSYQPPVGERQFLVGMHMAVSNGASESYFRWATLWVPRPPGDTLTKDGSPLEYNESCNVGHNDDILPNVEGRWRNFVLCRANLGEEEFCGNPWGPPDECKALSCGSCHIATGTVPLPAPGLADQDYLALAWLPTLTDAKVKTCYDTIALANFGGIALYKSKAPDACQ